MTSTHPVYLLIRECVEPGSTELGSVCAGESMSEAVKGIGWGEVYAEMREQSIDAMPKEWLEEHALPDDALREKWIHSCYMSQGRWIKVMHGQDQLLELMEKEKIDCVIIKGAAAAIAYPRPTLRKCGDIDFLVRQEDYERAAKVLEENGFELEHEKNSELHHYGYARDGVCYELHRRLGIVSEENRELIRVFEEGIANREFEQIEGHCFPVLPADLNGLVLLFHINQHLRSGLGLRQIIDWMVYLRRNDNLEKLLPMLRETGMETLALTVTAACQEYFGLKVMVEEPERYPVEELMEYIWEKGNFGRKAGEDGKIEFFFMTVSNPVKLFKRLQKGGLLRWKAARKCAFLRPFAWIFQIGFILRELAINRITPGMMLELRKEGVQHRELLRKLGLDVDRYV